jgi:hypothetical protein
MRGYIIDKDAKRLSMPCPVFWGNVRFFSGGQYFPNLPVKKWQSPFATYLITFNLFFSNSKLFFIFTSTSVFLRFISSGKAVLKVEIM